jgi:aspartate aminotransferase
MFAVNQGLFAFFQKVMSSGRFGQPDVNNFVFGNPNEMPLSGFVDALQRWSVPQENDWFAYKMSEPESQRIVAESLRRSRGLLFEPDDIAMTTGAFGALAVCLDAIVDPGDEVIFPTPPWFFYEMLILHAGGAAVRVPVDSATFDLDLDAIRGAITERTRAIIINSPNNPTGKIYPPETLEALAKILTDASQRNGRTIYLLSDEAYSRILYGGRDYFSPVVYYPNSFLIYTYGKTLLTPGQRIGYIALPPTMPDREAVRGGLFMTQLALGHAFPNALLQHALPDLETLSIDIGQLERRRDRMTSALREMGYDVHTPEGTFYLLPRSPWQDDVAFVDLLAERNNLCLPGTIVEMPGYFRISLTANDEMVERSLSGFRTAMQDAKSGAAS